MASREEYFDMAMKAFFLAETGPEDAAENDERILQLGHYLCRELGICFYMGIARMINGSATKLFLKVIKYGFSL